MWKALTDAPEVEYEPGLDALCKEYESGRLFESLPTLAGAAKAISVILFSLNV